MPPTLPRAKAPGPFPTEFVGGLRPPLAAPRNGTVDPEFRCHGIKHRFWHGHLVIQKGHQKPQCSQLHAKIQTATLATTATNQLQIPVFKNEEPFQLVPRNRTWELTIHRYLVITEKLNLHMTGARPIAKVGANHCSATGPIPSSAVRHALESSARPRGGKRWLLV